MDENLANEVVADLLRSAWIVEAARADLYARWSGEEARFDGWAERARRRAGIVERSLGARNGKPDRELVAPHSSWIGSLAGAGPGEVPLGDLFTMRLGDWVESHAGAFVEERDELSALGAEDKAEASFPSELPAPPPFEPLEAPALEPPGGTLFRFGILGDLHFGSKRGEPTARAAIADLNASGAELVIQLGDLTDHGDRDEYELAARVLEELEMPYATMIGNHDVFSVEEERLVGREFYAASFGREPDGILLEHKGFRFCVLDSAEHGASPFAPFDLVTGTFIEGPGGAIVRGSLTAPQHDLLAEVAAPGAPPTFVFLHHPPQPYTGFPPVLFGLRDADTGRLHATCDSGNVWGVFAGHTHRNARTRNFDGVPAHEVGIPRDYPFGYALVDVGDEGYAYRFLQLSDEELLRSGYRHSGQIHRRYARGADDERAFVWRRG
jgi:predicted phosphodiesterase